MNLDNRPSESLKPLAKELSALLWSKNGDAGKKIELFRQLQPALDAREPGERKEDPQEVPEDTVGIWKRISKDGKLFFRRDFDQRADWLSWADVHDIPPKGNRRRIVLLGESVARGYYYDPYYNVAKELEAILKAQRLTVETEIIDLARTGMGMQDLCRMMRSCIRLEPDAVIIFGGNNWELEFTGSLEPEDQENIQQTFYTHGFPGMKTLMEQKFSRLVSDLLGCADTTLVGKGIPVIMMIPEFNLRDWKSVEPEQGMMWMPDGANEKWLCARDAAREAKKNRDMDRFGVAAAEMVGANPAHPLGFEWLGEFHAHCGQYEEARKAFATARDLILFTGRFCAPRCYGLIQDGILKEAPALGIRVIDLPAVFAHEWPDHIPNRDQFLDYCHLTIEGIKLAMRHAAREVIEVLTGKSIPVSSVRASALFPDKNVLAIAHFGAAIHNSHTGQPAELLRYHCARAIGYSPEAKQPMMEFMDFATRRSSSIFCKSFEKIAAGRKMRQYDGGVVSLANPARRKLLDVDLVDAIVNALHTVNIHLGEEIGELRTKEHHIGPEGIDLLESFYSRTDYNSFIGVPDSIVYGARTTESLFRFVFQGDGSGLAFSITCRTPGREDDGKCIGIFVNDVPGPIAKVPMGARWTTNHFTIGPGQLRKGLNTLRIGWPYTFQPLQPVHSTSHHMKLKQVYPVLGEISALRVRALQVE